MALTSATLTFGSNGEQAGMIADAQNKIDPNFSQKILPGKKATVNCGFSVPKSGLGDLQLQVGMGDLQHDAAVFVGAVR